MSSYPETPISPVPSDYPPSPVSPSSSSATDADAKPATHHQHHHGKKKRAPPKARFTPQQTLLLSVASAAIALLIQTVIMPPADGIGFIAGVKIVWWVLVAAYLPTFFDGTENTATGRVSPWRDYKPIGRWFFPSPDCFLKFDDQHPDPSKQYIVLLSPHGVFSMGHWFLNTAEFTSYFGTKRRSLAGDVVFKIPLYRDMMLAGGLVSADARVCEQALEEGYTTIVLPGGIIEQVSTRFNEQAVYIRARKGIFRYALRYNLPIVPIYSMNEVSMTKTSGFMQKFRDYLAKAFWLPIFICSPIIDCSRIACYGGNPITMKMAGTEPTDAEVTQFQDLYIAELQRLYAKYHVQWGHAQTEIKIR